MSSTATVSASMLEFLRWVAARRRTYTETMEAWRTSCPRFSVWEDASIDGYVALRDEAGEQCVFLTPQGAALLAD
jgi:hypothetical protein